MTVTIHVGDCRDVLKTLPDESVQCVVTSPPYWGLRDYGVDGQLGLEPTPELYTQHLVEIFRDVRRVLRDDGVVFLNLGDSYASGGKSGEGETRTVSSKLHASPDDPSLNCQRRSPVPAGLKPKDLVGIPWRVAFALQSDGWWLRSDIIWAKPNCMPESVTDRPTKSHEYVFLLSKSARYFYDADAIRESGNHSPHASGRKDTDQYGDDAGNRKRMLGIGDDRAWGAEGKRNKRTVWTISTHAFSQAHFATFPPALVEPMIKAGTSERGCCAACGAPWERTVEKERRNTRPGIKQKGAPDRNDGGIPYRPETTVTTTGWRPTCECGVCSDKDLGGAAVTNSAPEPVPCVCLDPFAGAGTVGLVADRLQRDAILIELNAEYAEMARERIKKDSPMFTTVEVHSD